MLRSVYFILGCFSKLFPEGVWILSSLFWDNSSCPWICLQDVVYSLMCMLNHHCNTGMKLICGEWSKIYVLGVCVWTCHTAQGSQRTTWGSGFSSSTMWALWHHTKCLSPPLPSHWYSLLCFKDFYFSDKVSQSPNSLYISGWPWPSDPPAWTPQVPAHHNQCLQHWGSSLGFHAC